MKIKLSAVVLSLLLPCILLTGCLSKQEATAGYEFSINYYLKTDGFEVDNNTPLCDLLTTEYELSDLYHFFGENICEGDRIISLNNPESLPAPRTWNEVNHYFPIQCLRYNSNVHYSIYKVKNGGYFYVFWNVPILNPPYMQSFYDTTTCTITTRTSIYIDQLPTIFSFRSIVKGQSTAKDIEKIDPCMELDFLSSSVKSYSRLQSGKILVVYYDYQVLETKDDLIVKKIEIKSNSCIASCIAAIHTEDIQAGQGDRLLERITNGY